MISQLNPCFTKKTPCCEDDVCLSDDGAVHDLLQHIIRNTPDSKLADDSLYEPWDVFICCESRLTSIRGKRIGWIFHHPLELASLRWTSALHGLVVVGHTSCLKEFFHQACGNIPMEDWSRRSMNPRHSWWCIFLLIFYPLSLSRKIAQNNLFWHNHPGPQSDSKSAIEAKAFFVTFRGKICLKTDQKWQRVAKRFIVKVMNFILQEGIYVVYSINHYEGYKKEYARLEDARVCQILGNIFKLRWKKNTWKVLQL